MHLYNRGWEWFVKPTLNPFKILKQKDEVGRSSIFISNVYGLFSETLEYSAHNRDSLFCHNKGHGHSYPITPFNLIQVKLEPQTP